MKILYGINSNGQGHINRSRVFINELMKDGHEIHVFLAGRNPPAYAYDLAPIVRFKPGPIGVYNDHSVNYSKTISWNFSNIAEYTRARKELHRLDEQENFDFIISDFEPFTSIVGKQLEKPVIGIDHQNSIFHPASDQPESKFSERLAFKFVLSYMFPYFDHCFCLDYTNEIQRVEDETIFPLVRKPELDDYDVSIGDHFVTYLARYNPKEIIEIFSQFPEEKFYVYGFDMTKQVKNIQFKMTSRKGFLNDLVTSKAVIGNAGFSLSWETTLLDKFIWMIPYRKQLEQISNAYRLEKKKRAYVSYFLTAEDFKKFNEWIKEENYEPKTKLTILEPRDLIAHVYDYLDEYDAQKFEKTDEFIRPKLINYVPKEKTAAMN
jgi:uncharacterized protein (TIGR00661 family)